MAAIEREIDNDEEVDEEENQRKEEEKVSNPVLQLLLVSLNYQG